MSTGEGFLPLVAVSTPPPPTPLAAVAEILDSVQPVR